jgi:hypothetical protein
MAASDLGEFSFKAITVTNTRGPAGSILTQVNWEGTATGFGAIFNTTTYIGDESGTFGECAIAYPDSGDAVRGIGEGTFRSAGKHRWNTKGFLQLSDGRRIATEGEIDLAGRSYRGKIIREMT